MTAVDTHALRLLLRPVLVGVAGITEADVAWENRNFEKPSPDSDSSLWFRETLIVSDERKTSTGFVQALGQYRIDVFCPVGVGTEEAEDKTKEIMDAFQTGTSVSGGGLAVNLYRTHRLPGRNDPGPNPVWHMIPVVVNWRTHTPV